MAHTSIHIRAAIMDNGNLQISGHDLWAALLQMLGQDEYEYWLTFPANQKDALLLALLEKLYGGDGGVVSKLTELAKEKSLNTNSIRGIATW